MIKAVIFDLDGLLIDSEIVSYKIYKEILNQFGHSFSIEEYAQNFSGKTEVYLSESSSRSFMYGGRGIRPIS